MPAHTPHTSSSLRPTTPQPKPQPCARRHGDRGVFDGGAVPAGCCGAGRGPPAPFAWARASPAGQQRVRPVQHQGRACRRTSGAPGLRRLANPVAVACTPAKALLCASQPNVRFCPNHFASNPPPTSWAGTPPSRVVRREPSAVPHRPCVVGVIRKGFGRKGGRRWTLRQRGAGGTHVHTPPSKKLRVNTSGTRDLRGGGPRQPLCGRQCCGAL